MLSQRGAIVFQNSIFFRIGRFPISTEAFSERPGREISAHVVVQFTHAAVEKTSAENPPHHLGAITRIFNLFSTAVPFWGQTTLISSSLSPQRDCGPERVKVLRVWQISRQEKTPLVWYGELLNYPFLHCCCCAGIRV